MKHESKLKPDEAKQIALHLASIAALRREIRRLKEKARHRARKVREGTNAESGNP